jgi:hypothetical protein
MNPKSHIKYLIVAGIVFLAFASGSKAQSVKNSELFQEIAKMDSILFDAFNKRDVEKLKILFSTDLEFYHDIDGLSDYKTNMERFTQLATRKTDLRRDLVKEDLEVFPLKEFGAMQVGVHRFCHTENNKQDCGTFRFVHIWKKTDGQWKITRVMSFGH